MFSYITLILTFLIVLLVLPLKALIGRERPTRITHVFRFCNMRDKEHGKAMPSGDSAAGAYFLALYALVFSAWPLIFFIPLVCLGRVYVHCHWIVDTVVGAILGYTIAIIFF